MNQPLHPNETMNHAARAAYTPEVRQAGRDVLSLALMDARNYTLALFEAFSPLSADAYQVAADCAVPSPLWSLARLAWLQERVALRGEAKARSRLEQADQYFAGPRPKPAAQLPRVESLKTYLFDVMSDLLDALASAAETDEALHAFRWALLWEDQCAEALHVALQALELKEVPVCRQSPSIFSANQSILMPDYQFTWGKSGREPGFAPDEEYEAHGLHVPAFEIDAALVSWAQYADFIVDGGYDEPAHWSREGLAWLTQTGRRVPLYVEQANTQVIVKRFGRLVRADLREPVRHVTLWEAEAYTRWAGRRLPAEAEWARAAQGLTVQGFRWGALHEWTATRYRDWPGYQDTLQQRYGLQRALPEGAQAVRGASFASSPRLQDARVRSYLPPEAAHHFVGFRTCAL